MTHHTSCSFYGSDLSEASFSGSICSNTEFQATKIRKTFFVGASLLHTANFDGADIGSAVFNESDTDRLAEASFHQLISAASNILRDRDPKLSDALRHLSTQGVLPAAFDEFLNKLTDAGRVEVSQALDEASERK